MEEPISYKSCEKGTFLKIFISVKVIMQYNMYIKYTTLAILMLTLSACSNSIYLNSPEGYQTISIRELSQNSDIYLNQNVTISGMINRRVGGPSLQDSEGYWVWMDPNCLESQREYQYMSRTYTAVGTLVPPKTIGAFGIGIDSKTRLSCNKPLQ